MQWKRTIMLLAVLAFIGAFYIWLKVGNHPFPGAMGPGLLSFSPDQVISLSGSYGGATLQRSPARGAGLLKTLEFLAGAKLAAKGTLASFGLAQPALVLKLNLRDGTVRTLAVGNLALDQSGYYASTGNNKVELISVMEMDALSAYFLTGGK